MSVQQEGNNMLSHSSTPIRSSKGRFTCKVSVDNGARVISAHIWGDTREEVAERAAGFLADNAVVVSAPVQGDIFKQ